MQKHKKLISVETVYSQIFFSTANLKHKCTITTYIFSLLFDYCYFLYNLTLLSVNIIIVSPHPILREQNPKKHSSINYKEWDADVIDKLIIAPEVTDINPLIEKMRECGYFLWKIQNLTYYIYMTFWYIKNLLKLINDFLFIKQESYSHCIKAVLSFLLYPACS